MRSVLVTGAAGFVGRATVAALAERRAELRQVVALDLVEVRQGDRRDGVVHVAMDIGSPELADLMRRFEIDTVVHLASLVRTPPGAPPDLAYRVDVEGTRNVLAAMLACGATRLVVTSSGAAYGYHADNPAWLTEDDALRGNDDFPYARHKRLVEEMLRAFSAAHPGIGILIFRPGTVLGPGVRSPVTDLFEKPVLLGIRGSDSPFVFVWDDDVVACLLRGVFEDGTGAYNLAGDGALTGREIARLLRKPYLPLPASLVRAILATLKRLGVTEHGPERVKFLRYRPVLSNRRLKEDFGYVPRSTSRQAFERYVAGRKDAR